MSKLNNIEKLRIKIALGKMALIALTIILIILMAIAVTSVEKAGTYTVQPGDMSLWCIANDGGFNFWDLVLANTGPGLDPDLIRVGDVIQLP